MSSTPASIAFSKMHGLGNDFVVINALATAFNPNPEWCRWVGDRHFGVGFDQLLIVRPPTQPHHDFYYAIYNNDGSLSGQCGNGARCFAHFVRVMGLSNKPTLTLGVLNGEITVSAVPAPAGSANRSVSNTGLSQGYYRVNMGAPVFTPAHIPYSGIMVGEGLSILTFTDHVGKTQKINIATLSMGNPHVVLVVDDINTAPVAQWGPIIENHPYFPQKVNVSFMQVQSQHTIALRVFERGAGETMACGSGACAAVVAGVLRGMLSANSPIAVHLPGGTLMLSWAGNKAPVMMEGPAVEVFRSECPLILPTTPHPISHF